MVKVAKYFLMTVVVALFCTVVICQSLYLDKITTKVRSSGIGGMMLMSSAGNSYSKGDLLRELEKSDKSSKSDEKEDEENYRNPALDYEGVDTSSLKNRGAGLGTLESKDVVIRRLQEPSQSSGSTSMQGDPRDILRKRYNSEDPTTPEDVEKEKTVKKADYSGYYQLQIAMGSNNSYDVYAQIDELDNSFLRISGKHAYTEFSFIAVPTDVTTETGSWKVTKDTGSFLKSVAVIDITEREGFCQLEGEAISSYNALLIKGKKTAKITGIKVSETKPEETDLSIMNDYNTKVEFLAPDNSFEKPSPIKSGSATAVAGLAVAFTGIAASRAKNRNVGSMQNTNKVKKVPEERKLKL